MSDHLPECKAVPEDSDLRWCTCKTHLPECPILASPENAICFCRALRACEQRVLSVAGPHNYSRGRKDGYSAGVQAARDAVAAAYDDPAPMKDGMTLREEIAEMYGRKVMFEDAIDAIDALKGES